MSGRISIGGEDIKGLECDLLRSHVSLVHQQQKLFRGTILQNLILGSKDHDKVCASHIDDSIGFSALEETISRLPRGLWTIIGSEGDGLSGGQKQRLALARARLRDAPILVLDEVTSALDKETACRIMNNIRAWRHDKTTIIITHDLTQILPEDYVYVLDHGRVVQEGYRKTLEDEPGSFAKLLAPLMKSPQGTLASTEQASVTRNVLLRDQIEGSSQNRLRFTENEPRIRAKTIRAVETDDSEFHSDQVYSNPGTRLLVTVWSSLDSEQRMRLLCGFLSATLHATAIPAFSWCFSRLLGTFIEADNVQSQSAVPWSLAILLLATIDGIASYYMQLILEGCDQFWASSLRARVFWRVLNQPSLWFHHIDHSALNLRYSLDRDAEELRPLLSRLVGSIIVAVLIMSIAVLWAVLVCWKLTLLGICCIPLLYLSATAFESADQRCQLQLHDAIQEVERIFVETFENIQHVRALTLENHFRNKLSGAASHALEVGVQKTIRSGVYFGCSDACAIAIIGKLLGATVGVKANQDNSSALLVRSRTCCV